MKQLLFKIFFWGAVLMGMAGVGIVAFPRIAWSTDAISYVPTYEWAGIQYASYWTQDLVLLGLSIIALATPLFIIAVMFVPQTFMEQWKERSEKEFDLSADAYRR